MRQPNYSKKLVMEEMFKESCSILGSLYIQGLGLSRDYHAAKEYFGKACDLGDQKGCDFYKELNKKGF